MKNHGFSLCELSIVLAIIALLTGTALAGNRLLDKARDDNIINNIGKINKAVGNFNQLYGCYPGDCWQADNILHLPNGDGDGKLQTEEKPLFWAHLLSSGFLIGRQQEDAVIYDKRNYEVVSINPLVIRVGSLSRNRAMLFDQKYDNNDQNTGNMKYSCEDECEMSFRLRD
jgi:prepilin-type N-terminal cleavage/methylation domain-containing protein